MSNPATTLSTTNLKSKQLMYSPVFKAIYTYENLLYPVSTTILGYSNYGAYGALAGAVIGTVDLIAITTKIYSKPHFTHAVLGASTLNQFETPYHIAEIIGAAGGFAIGGGVPTSWVEPVKNSLPSSLAPIVDSSTYESVVAPLKGAMHGHNLGKSYGVGVIGAAIGGSLGIIDEGLSLYNITNNYYCTSALEVAATTNLLIPNAARVTKYLLPNKLGFLKTIPVKALETLKQPVWRSSASFIMAAINIAYNYNEEYEPKEKWAALKIQEDLYDLYGEQIPADELDELMSKQAVATVTSQLTIAKLSLELSALNQGLEVKFASVSTGDKSWKNFLIAHRAIAYFIIPYVANHMSNNFMSAYLNTKIRYKIHDQYNDKYHQNETALHLAQNSSSTISSNTLLNKKDDDISATVDDGNSLVIEGFGAAINGGYNIVYLCANNAEDMIIYSDVYNKITNIVSSFIAIKATSFDAEIEEIDAKLTSIDTYEREHALEMIQTNANEFIKLQKNELTTELRTFRESALSWNTLNRCWMTGKYVLDVLYNYVIVANKIHLGELKSSEGVKIITASGPISELFGWHASKAGEIIKVEQSTTRLKELNKRTEEANSELEHQVQYKFKQADQPAICFNNLKVGVQDESRFHLDDLCTSGQRIAVIARSGGGKSTFLNIAKAITRSEAWGEGEITYYTKTGNAPKITMTQRQYIPPHNSLLELITFKRGDEAKQFENEVVRLLEEVKINSEEDKAGAKDLISRLHNKENWKDILSDGQIQKVAGLRVIIEKPDIAILDELLKGLDPHSTQIMEEMLIKYLPSTLFLVVDHHAKTNNFNDFYQSALYFTNGTAITKDINEIAFEHVAPVIIGNATDYLVAQDDS